MNQNAIFEPSGSSTGVEFSGVSLVRRPPQADTPNAESVCPDPVNLTVYRIVPICSKCTRFRVFEAETRLAAKILAKKKGWKFVNDAAVCPKCPSAGAGNYQRR